MEGQDGLKSAIAIYLIYIFGILWHIIPATLEYVLFLTPFVLLLTHLLVLYPEVKSGNYSLVLWLAAVYIITFGLEVGGVTTGEIFGSYTYGRTLGFKALDVPLVIGLNWGMIIWGCAELTSRFRVPLALKIAASASSAVLLDFLIEPAAMRLDYWNWSGSVIPLRNYIAWFVIASVFISSYYLLKIRSESRLPEHFFLSQVIFFGILNLAKV